MAKNLKNREHANNLNEKYFIYEKAQPFPVIKNICVIRCFKDGKLEFCINTLHIDDLCEKLIDF